MKRVLVTGSGPGIGQAIAERFASEGATVQLVARGQTELDETQQVLERYGVEVRSLALDLMHPDAAERILAEILQAWVGINILVTNA